jgi:hypothetical protein
MGGAPVPAVPLPSSDQPIQVQRAPQMPMPMSMPMQMQMPREQPPPPPPPPLPPPPPPPWGHSDQPNVSKRWIPISLFSSPPACHSSNQPLLQLVSKFVPI